MALYQLPADWPLIGWAVLMALAYGVALLGLAGRRLARRELL